MSIIMSMTYLDENMTYHILSLTQENIDAILSIIKTFGGLYDI